VTDREIAPRLSRRAALLGLVVGVPASVAFLVLAMRGLDAHELRETLADADARLVALAIGAIALVYVLQAQRWRIIARHESELSLPRALGYVVGAVAVNNVVPGRPGEPLRAFWFARYAHIPVARGLATVVVDRFSDTFALVALFALTVGSVDAPRWVVELLVAALALGFALACVLAGAWWYTNRSARGRRRAALDRGERSWLRQQGSGLVRGVAGSLRRRDLPAVGGLSLLAWGAWSFAAWLVARSLGIELSAVEAVFATSLVNLGVAIPSSPGFIGTYQWLSVSVLALFGVERTDAFAFSVLMHATWYIPTTLAGVGLAVAAAARRSAATAEAPT